MIERMVSFVMPSVRPANCIRTIKATLAQSKGHNVEIVLVTERLDVLQVVEHMLTGDEDARVNIVYSDIEPRGSVRAWNDGLKEARGEYICLWSDDAMPHAYFLDNALPMFKQWPDGVGYVAFNDLHVNPDQLSVFYIAHREYIVKYQGGVLVYPCYQGLFSNLESTMRAMIAGKFGYADTAIVEHLRPISRERAVYSLGGMMANVYSGDFKVFLERRDQWFPDDWEPAIKE